MTPAADNGADSVLAGFYREADAAYRAAEERARARVEEYLGGFEADDFARRAEVEQGLLTRGEYATWRRVNICSGKAWERLLRDVAADYAEADAEAARLLRGRVAEAWAEGANRAAWELETTADA